MDFFIIKWEVLEENDGNDVILGFTNDGKCIRVVDYKPYAFVEEEQEQENGSYRFIRGNKEAQSVGRKVFENNKEMRDYKNKCSLGRGIYEDDIPPLLKFLSDLQLSYAGWIRIENCLPLSRSVSITECDEYAVRCEGIKDMNDIIQEVPDVKILAFDIECYSKDRGMSDARNEEDVIFMISMVFINNQEGDPDSYVLAVSSDNPQPEFESFKYESYESEFLMLETFFNKILEHDPSIIIGYNIMGFDMKYIKDKYYSQLLNIPNGGRCKEKYLRDEIISRVWQSAAYGIVNTTIFNFTGRCCFDIYQYLKMEVPLQKYSLDFVSNHLLGERKVDMPYNTMFRMYEEGKVKELANYCFVDSMLTVKLWKKLNLWYTLSESSKVFCVDIHELYSRGQQRKIFSQLYFYAHSRGYIFDKVKKMEKGFGYPGATVLQPQPGIYNQCAVVDFASLYPSIIISENICYTTHDQELKSFSKDHQGIIPQILKTLIKKRREVKEILKITEDDLMKVVYNKRQFAYKVATNSFYGAFGSRDSPYLQLVDGAKLVTKIGRSYLQRAVDIINNHPAGCTVIYGDTDSCFFVKKGDDKLIKESVEEVVNSVNEKFPDPVHIEFEEIFQKILLLSKKKYIYISEGEIKSKGVITAKRDSCFWAREIYKSVITMILEGKSNYEVNDYLKEEIMKLFQESE